MMQQQQQKTILGKELVTTKFDDIAPHPWEKDELFKIF